MKLFLIAMIFLLPLVLAQESSECTTPTGTCVIGGELGQRACFDSRWGPCYSNAFKFTDLFDYGEDQSSHAYSVSGQTGESLYLCGDDEGLRLGYCAFGGGSVTTTMTVTQNTEAVALYIKDATCNSGSEDAHVNIKVDGHDYGGFKFYEDISVCGNELDRCLVGQAYIELLPGMSTDSKIVVELSDPDPLTCSGDPHPTHMWVYSKKVYCVPSTEICDGLDNNCDGTIDEECIACKVTKDCETENRTYCSESKACVDSDIWRCINPGTTNAECRHSGIRTKCEPEPCDTVCLAGTCIECILTGDCPKQKERYCSEGELCVDSTIWRCINPGTTNAECRDSGTGTDCNPCASGYVCEDGYCNLCTSTTEVCDGKDNDCDGDVDEENVCDTEGNSWLGNWQSNPRTCKEICTESGTEIDYDGCYASDLSKCIIMKSGVCLLENEDTYEIPNDKHTACCCKGTDFKGCTSEDGVDPFEQRQTNDNIDSCDNDQQLREHFCSNKDYINYVIIIDCDCKDGRCISGCVKTPEVCDGKDNDCDGDVDEQGVCDGVTWLEDLGNPMSCRDLCAEVGTGTSDKCMDYEFNKCTIWHWYECTSNGPDFVFDSADGYMCCCQGTDFKGCTSTDGWNSFVKGKTIGTGDVTEDDCCTPNHAGWNSPLCDQNDKRLIEYQCDVYGDSVSLRYLECPNGCKNGACLTSTCNTNADCDDDNTCTTDTCNGACQNTRISNCVTTTQLLDELKKWHTGQISLGDLLRLLYQWRPNE